LRRPRRCRAHDGPNGQQGETAPQHGGFGGFDGRAAGGGFFLQAEPGVSVKRFCAEHEVDELEALLDSEALG
jgi:hypothetical protein